MEPQDIRVSRCCLKSTRPSLHYNAIHKNINEIYVPVAYISNTTEQPVELMITNACSDVLFFNDDYYKIAVPKNQSTELQIRSCKYIDFDYKYEFPPDYDIHDNTTKKINGDMCINLPIDFNGIITIDNYIPSSINHKYNPVYYRHTNTPNMFARIWSKNSTDYADMIAKIYTSREFDIKFDWKK
jgi:hypothetical protein